MNCKGIFINDRTCELCKETNEKEYTECIKEHQDKTNAQMKLYEIKGKCPHRKTAYDEYVEFDACNLNGNGYGRHADDCVCSLKCEKYIQKGD